MVEPVVKGGVWRWRGGSVCRSTRLTPPLQTRFPGRFLPSPHPHRKEQKRKKTSGGSEGGKRFPSSLPRCQPQMAHKAPLPKKRSIVDRRRLGGRESASSCSPVTSEEPHRNPRSHTTHRWKEWQEALHETPQRSLPQRSALDVCFLLPTTMQ